MQHCCNKKQKTQTTKSLQESILRRLSIALGLPVSDSYGCLSFLHEESRVHRGFKTWACSSIRALYKTGQCVPSKSITVVAMVHTTSYS